MIFATHPVTPAWIHLPKIAGGNTGGNKWGRFRCCRHGIDGDRWGAIRSGNLLPNSMGTLSLPLAP